MLRVLPLVVLSACASVNPLTALHLSMVDPLTADPGAIELALSLPPGLQVRPGSARLELGAERGEVRIGDSFLLDEHNGIYALTDADAARMREVQAQITVWRAEGPGQAFLGVGLGACTVGTGPAPDATGSVLIRLEQGGDFLPLIQDGRIADLIGAGAIAAMERCPGRF